MRAKFLDLARELGELGAWVRLHYVYPYPHVDDVIPLMADGKVLPYLDIPFQHAAPDVLKRMKRPAAQEKTLERIARWREICPDLTIRSTFIVGFPGETEAGFRDAARLARRGRSSIASAASATSRCAARVANDLAAPVPNEVKEERWHRFMQRQQAISAKRLKRKVGTRQQVIIDEVGPTVAKGRSQGRRAGDRRRGLCGEPAAAARRRDRHGEDRARRRIRPARHGGRILIRRSPSLRLESQLLHQLLLLGDSPHHEGAIIRGVEIERLLVDLGDRLDVGRLLHALLERVVKDFTTFGSMPFGPARPNGEFDTMAMPRLLQRRHIRPALAALVGPDHQQAQLSAVDQRRPAAGVGDGARCGRRAARWSIPTCRGTAHASI